MKLQLIIMKMTGIYNILIKIKNDKNKKIVIKKV